MRSSSAGRANGWWRRRGRPDPGLDPATIDEVILGCIAQPSDAPNLARMAALMAGGPKEVPGYVVARNCASGMDAIVQAWKSIEVGDGETYSSAWEALTDPLCGQLMGRTAENLAEEFGISRQAQEDYAVQSHKQAIMATRMEKIGRFPG
jgi:acetyl-CoA C-acetyltransferase